MWDKAALLLLLVAVALKGLTFLATIDPAPLSFPPLRKLNVTAHIIDIEKFFEDDPAVVGPESFVLNDDGSFFTGTARGDILKVFLPSPHDLKGVARYEEVARTGPAVDRSGCGALANEAACGRPLGMRRDPSRPVGHLLVCDAYQGLLRVDTASGLVVTLVDAVSHGLALVNDLDVSSDGKLAFFTSTGRFPRNEIHRNLIEARPGGAVWVVDLATGAARPLVEGLTMANGLTLTFEGDALLVTVLQGLVRIELPADLAVRVASGEGLPLTTAAKLVQNDLQGTPDNIRRFAHGRRSGSYLVALGSKRASPFNLPQFLAPYPSLRKLSSLLGLEPLTALIPKAGLIVEVDAHGQVLATFQDPLASVFWLSEAESLPGDDLRLLLGSWRGPFVARARLAVVKTPPPTSVSHGDGTEEGQ
jgi:hypothetical protein